MRIFIYGECEEYGSGAWCYYQTLKDMGHSVDYYSPHTTFEVYKTFLFKVIRKLNGRVLPHHRKLHVKQFLQSVINFKPEIVIILKGLHVDQSTVQEIKRSNAWVVLINHDDFFSAYKNSRSPIQFNAIPYYDFVFPTKEVNVHELSRYNKNIEFFPFSYSEKIHKPPQNENEEDRKKWATDVVFVGTRYPERTRQLEYLVSNIGGGIELKIYGNNWNTIAGNSPLKKYVQNKTLKPEEMTKAIFYSKISLGFLCKENRDDYTQRTFEIPATKGLLLAERTKRHLSYFREGIEADFFDSNNYDELVSKVQHLLQNNQYRKELKEAGYSAVINNHHSYKDRLSRLLEIYLAHHSTVEEN